MLILTRKRDESIIIDDKIEVKIISLEDGKVKLGISAPDEITIHRKEVYMEIKEENKAAVVTHVNMTALTKFFKKSK